MLIGVCQEFENRVPRNLAVESVEHHFLTHFWHLLGFFLDVLEAPFRNRWGFKSSPKNSRGLGPSPSFRYELLAKRVAAVQQSQQVPGVGVQESAPTSTKKWEISANSLEIAVFKMATDENPLKHFRTI
jgi:hypothetical protein